MDSSVELQIKQLGDARKLVLSDASHYPQIIQGILPIAAPGARVELRRWVADFLAETFAAPSLPSQQKETLSLLVLETLKNMIENPQEDPAVVRSVVQTAASVYPLVMRWIINNSYDSTTWERMTAIKSRILRMWDTAIPGVRICCIKFAQKVVLVQTKGPDADPRRGTPLEVSLSMVPSNHPLIPPKNLEAEASGLLDRMLAVFHENSSDAILVDATLNSLSILIRSRPQTSNKILNIILSFNPLKQANSPMNPKLRVMVKSMEKTTRLLLLHVLKRDQQHPLAGKMHQYIERMMRARADIFDESSRKRGAPEPTDGSDAAKRQKLGAPAPVLAPKFHVPPLAPGPHTIAELFTVTTDEALKAFDVSQLPDDLVLRIGITILQRIDASTLNQAVEGVRQRYKILEATKPAVITAAAHLDVEEEDDYEPDFDVAEDTEQILNKLDGAPPEEPKVAIPSFSGRFTLPAPPPLTTAQASEVGLSTVYKVFDVMRGLEERGKKSKAGINRLAASAYDRDAWITILTRIATRAPAGLEALDSLKAESDVPSYVSLADNIREFLCGYVLEDFRKRIDIALAWLCEEWYNDKMQMKEADQDATILHYDKWVFKILDGMVPYLDGQDRGLVIKFLSDIPGLSMEVLDRVKKLCRDPATVNMALQSLLFLVAYRPPVRELVLNAVEDVWDTYEDARPTVVKLFSKWRPGLTERSSSSKPATEGDKEMTKPLLNNGGGSTVAVVAT
ncbi:mRNA cleavage and polyadenylation specificity factor complex subunit [Drepanopeziza brunnea f. sp. 'multigermtubi' MB_m1]|uniref:mRNA cleavage and polyadenylation specificity factor complex subunit n=1 Tax=Marssonina brunnea f. sp. multigermtubi (strain MB_m1) TaxID=1072389 RepID=K1W6J4_MARBU|nr:mRNA cleavage and polyadenylation specificity factor complex subunit [Drepanopeziza brunnea f. sp. 'multigermtubi' MB_m1]EKD12595.1 mRNA cleavage and polyadenylation specificity factor complex subunit [Drepanopeziza brunnea f. sp. 'multigermtubi' MB_m1]